MTIGSSVCSCLWSNAARVRSASQPRPLGAPTEARHYAYCYGSETDLGCNSSGDETEAKWFCQHGGLAFFDADSQFVAGYGFTSARTEDESAESDSPCLELQRWAGKPLCWARFLCFGCLVRPLRHLCGAHLLAGPGGCGEHRLRSLDACPFGIQTPRFANVPSSCCNL